MNYKQKLKLEYIIGRKWKPIILYYIDKHNGASYAELKKYIPKINERMLTRQLRELEQDSLINRNVVNKSPLRVEYTLTEYGNEVIPLLAQLREWGIKYNEEMEVTTFPHRNK